MVGSVGELERYLAVGVRGGAWVSVVVGGEVGNGSMGENNVKIFFIFLLRFYTLKYMKCCVLDICIICVCVFFINVVSSPITSGKCLHVGCAKMQKRSRLPSIDVDLATKLR